MEYKKAMKYRSFPKGEEKLSILGFGAMRLPLNSKKGKDINIALSTKMVRHAINQGVNYVDTAWPYHGGESEKFLGDALAGGYREKVYLATKLPSWMIKKPEDMERILNKQLEKLKTDHIDYYLIHSLNRKYWKLLNEYKLFDFIERALADGKIKHIGFSFHDDLELFKEIVDSYPWHFCQIQYNFLDIDHQAGEEGLAYAYEKGVGVIVMEPLRGGSFTNTIPDDIREIWDAFPGEHTPADWALRWVWNDPRVTLLLSGMSTFEQVAENAASAEKGEAGSLAAEDFKRFNQLRELYRARIQVPCTSCQYCMPCPHGVAIPDSFRFYNDAFMFDDREGKGASYRMFLSDKGADLCIACGECEPQCPQQIAIIEELVKVKETFQLEA